MTTPLADEAILVAASRILRDRSQIKAWIALGDLLSDVDPSDQTMRAIAAAVTAAEALDLAIRELAAAEVLS